MRGRRAGASVETMTDERPPSKNPWLAMNPMRRAIGIVLVVVGGVWVLQGIGVAKGSVMTGSMLWAVLGAACLVAGGIVLSRKPRPVDATEGADDPAPDEPPASPPTTTDSG
jgi:hypothetical protein